jgi:hypothetical protein
LIFIVCRILLPFVAVEQAPERDRTSASRQSVPRAKSEISRGVEVSKPTTSSIPGSAGSAIEPVRDHADGDQSRVDPRRTAVIGQSLDRVRFTRPGLRVGVDHERGVLRQLGLVPQPGSRGEQAMVRPQRAGAKLRRRSRSV